MNRSEQQGNGKCRGSSRATDAPLGSQPTCKRSRLPLMQLMLLFRRRYRITLQGLHIRTKSTLRKWLMYKGLGVEIGLETARGSGAFPETELLSIKCAATWRDRTSCWEPLPI